jgi:hypothetical protein
MKNRVLVFIVVFFTTPAVAFGWEASTRDENGKWQHLIVDTVDASYEPPFAALERNGDAAYRAKDFNQALQCYSDALKEKIVQDDGKFKGYLVFRRAQAFFQNGNYELARDEYCKLPDTDLEARIGAAESTYLLKEYKKSLTATESIAHTLDSKLKDKALHEIDRQHLERLLMRDRAVRGKANYQMGKMAEARKELLAYKPVVGMPSDLAAMEMKDKLEKTK